MDLKNWLRAQWDRALATLAMLSGALTLLLGYLGVRDALYPGQQIPYVISGGLLGVFLLGLAAVLWISADLRDEWRELDELDHKLGLLLDHHGIEPGAAVRTDQSSAADVTTSASDETTEIERPIADETVGANDTVAA